MMDTTNHEGRRDWSWIRPLAWGGAAALLVAPAIAMQFTREVNWGAGDFLFASLMFASIGLALELVVRMAASWFARAGAALALLTGFLLVWSNLAVGYIGSEDNPYNLVFFGVIAVAVIGSVIARFRAAELVWAMVAAALTHAAAGLGGLSADPITGPITLTFVGMWLVSAALFRKAARQAVTKKTLIG